MRVLDGDPERGPFDELDVVLAVAEGDRLLLREAHVRCQEVEARALRHTGGRELEKVRKRLRDVEAVAEMRLHPLLHPVELRRLADTDELRRRLVEPVEQVP